MDGAISDGARCETRVATMQTQSHFVIAPDADSLVSNLSGEFGDFILNLAVQSAAKRGGEVPEVTRADVHSTLTGICTILEKGINLGQLPPEAAEPVKQLREFCESLASSSGN